MGFLGWGRTPPASDPWVGVIQQVLDQQKDQQKELVKLVDRMLEVQQEQNQLTKTLLEQYVARGANETTTLDDRLFKAEADEATGWEPVLDDPFKGLGL